jgi:hypothetical protein
MLAESRRVEYWLHFGGVVHGQADLQGERVSAVGLATIEDIHANLCSMLATWIN